MANHRLKGAGSIFKRGKFYYLQARVNKATKLISLKTTNREEAEAKAAKLLPVLGADTKERVALYVAEARALARSGKVLLADAWEKFLKTRPNVSAGTLGNHERNWTRFMDWLKPNHPAMTALSQIDVETATEYLNHFASTGAHSDTCNKQKLTLAKIWDSLALEAGLKKAENPFREVESRKDPSHSRKDLTEKQLLAVMTTLDNPPFHLLNAAEVRVLFTLGGFAGMRLADAALLKWENVLFDRGIIAFKAIKTARSTERTVKIPIHPELRAQLEKALEWKDESGIYVLPGIAERYQRNPTGIKNDIIKIFEKLDYKTSVKLPGRLIPVSEYGFHSLRHTFVSICANRGVPLAIVQELVGHGNPAITRHYFHSDENMAKKAIATLPSSVSALKSVQELPKEKREDLLTAIKNALSVADDEKLMQISKLLELDI